MEGEGRGKGEYAPLDDWQPPPELGVHAKHLRNLYVYFWRWASRKVFEPVEGQAAGGGRGVVAFITAAGFLSGPGFVRMRQQLRRWCHEIWVIDCSPEGHQPEVATRVFQGVQQPVCIVIGVRQRDESKTEPAKVRWRALPNGHREDKFKTLAQLRLRQEEWLNCTAEETAPFLPISRSAWSSFPRLDELFGYNGSGVQPMRVWVIAPDTESLTERWKRLVRAAPEQKQTLFHPTLRGGQPADRHIDAVVRSAIPGYVPITKTIAEEGGDCTTPIAYGFRSFDRQWIIPDARLITQPNAALWQLASKDVVFLTAQEDRPPGSGPALTFTALPPDKHHFAGRSGRTFPSRLGLAGERANMAREFLDALGSVVARSVSVEDLFAYLAAIAAHPGFSERFHEDLATPGLRIPLTADPALFAEAVALGRRVIWLHTFGERFADAAEVREPGPPRLPPERRPRVPKDGAIPTDAEGMPNDIGYDAAKQRLLVGRGFIEPVPPAVWHYEVSGKRVLVQWFSYRRKNRERPMIGDRRPPSPLGDIQPDTWLAEYTTELLNVLNVLGLLVELEPAQADVLRRICEGPIIPASALPLGPTAGHHSASLDFGEP